MALCLCVRKLRLPSFQYLEFQSLSTWLRLRCSRVETQLALDMAIFINGLPIVTFELKNNLTRDTTMAPDNPPNRNGLSTDYLWKEVLSK